MDCFYIEIELVNNSTELIDSLVSKSYERLKDLYSYLIKDNNRLPRDINGLPEKIKNKVLQEVMQFYLSGLQ
jgi:predicted translin family RNA/ssDNA-binding protein